MKLLIKEIKKNILKIKTTKTVKNLEQIRIYFLGKKGILSKKIKTFKNLPINKKKKVFNLVNRKKFLFLREIKKRQVKLVINKEKFKLKKEKIDISLKGKRIENGSLHPITQSIIKIEHFFSNLGFSSIYGPEIEDTYHNFEALNIWKNHPSRTNHDTFWFNSKYLLRTQTSSSQIRILKQKKPPIKTIVPGKVYRNDSDSTHSPMFHQVEGLIVNKNTTFSNLKWLMSEFLKFFFKNSVEIRFRNSYFPFTFLSAEVDIKTNSGNWLEILGCGMIHPDILKKSNINPEKYSGCAFGLGVERITMLQYNIMDLRSFFKNDLRFLNQFK